jgi:predicted dehydrogenase
MGEECVKHATTRREFLETTAAVAASSWASASLYAADALASPGVNDTINLGVIGCGARCKEILPQFMKLPDIRVAAVCDVHSGHMDQVRQTVGGDKVHAHHDYRKLLDDKAVDAVIVATNAHWHVLCSIHACQAGKDVYLEKPASNFIGEGRFAIDAARKYDRIVQIGTQQHSREHYQKAVEIIKSGRLGNISEVKVWDCDNWAPGRGSPADCDPPKELDWDFYVGPSPMMPYNPNCYNDYGYDWFKTSGGGHQVAWGVHHFDVVHWAMGVQWPDVISAVGGKFAMPDDNRQWPDTFSAVAQYAPGPVAKNGFLLQYTMRIGCRREHRSHSKCFFGTDAALWIDRGRYTIIGETSRAGKKAVADVEVLAGDDEYRHIQVFIDNVRNRKKPIADIEVGHHATNVGHLMNVAYEVGRTIRWDGRREQVIDDVEANARVHRKYREPWKLEV